MKIISNCPLCEENSLHVIEADNLGTQQCINCGYASTNKFKGTKETNEIYKTLPEEMQNWSKEVNGLIWIPSMITLPFGTIYPINSDNQMKWAVALMVSIPENEQKKYPREDGNGYHTQKYDTDNQREYDLFLDAMAYMQEEARKNSVPDSKINLPKLNRIG